MAPAVGSNAAGPSASPGRGCLGRVGPAPRVARPRAGRCPSSGLSPARPSPVLRSRGGCSPHRPFPGWFSVGRLQGRGAPAVGSNAAGPSASPGRGCLGRVGPAPRVARPRAGRCPSSGLSPARPSPVLRSRGGCSPHRPFPGWFSRLQGRGAPAVVSNAAGPASPGRSCLGRVGPAARVARPREWALPFVRPVHRLRSGRVSASPCSLSAGFRSRVVRSQVGFR